MMAPCVAERGRRKYSGVEYNVPFREESCRSSCIYSGPLHSYSRDAVSQHPSTRAGAESIELIYSGRAIQALIVAAAERRGLLGVGFENMMRSWVMK